jgi:hypothetical protein
MGSGVIFEKDLCGFAVCPTIYNKIELMASVKQAWIRKYGEEEGLRRWKELNKGKGTLERYIAKYGEAEGTRLYLEKNKKLSISEDSLRANGKTEDEIKEIRARHAEKSKQTLENMIVRYGEVEGKKRYAAYRDKNRRTSNRTLDYWLSRCGGDVNKAKAALACWQRRDVKWFVARYGEVEGLERFEETNRKKGRTLQNYVEKHGAVEGRRRFVEACRSWKKGQHGIFNSKGQVEVEQFLQQHFNDVRGSRCETGFILTEQEKAQFLNQNTIYPDIVVNGKYIVEYDGDYWHANSEIFPDDDTVIGRIQQTAGYIRERDSKKDRFFEQRGYTTIRVWDSDWQTNKELVKRQLLNTIK